VKSLVESARFRRCTQFLQNKKLHDVFSAVARTLNIRAKLYFIACRKPAPNRQV
jgi:hypothetical protein